jgi:hypothetical protein
MRAFVTTVLTLGLISLAVWCVWSVGKDNRAAKAAASAIATANKSTTRPKYFCFALAGDKLSPVPCAETVQGK